MSFKLDAPLNAGGNTAAWGFLVYVLLGSQAGLRCGSHQPFVFSATGPDPIVLTQAESACNRSTSECRIVARLAPEKARP